MSSRHDKKEKKPDSNSKTPKKAEAGPHRTSTIPSRPAATPSVSSTASKPKVINVSATGEKYRMYTDVYFGEVDKRSKGCKLLVDSGKSFLRSVFGIQVLIRYFLILSLTALKSSRRLSIAVGYQKDL